MIRSSRLPAVMALAVLGFGLSACSVLKTPDPVQTYRFGAVPSFTSGQSGAATCTPTALGLRQVQFDDAARGDRLLSVTGSETAYIGGARWVSQAETLFQASLEEGFATGAPCLRLSAGAFSRDNLMLTVDVRRFATVYGSAGVAPQVRLNATARLIKPGDRSVVAEERIEVLEPVSANRVSAIVEGYERANAVAVRQIVEWTSATAPGLR